MWTKYEGGNTGQEVITKAQMRDYGTLNYGLGMSVSQIYANKGHFQAAAERAGVLFDWGKKKNFSMMH